MSNRDKITYEDLRSSVPEGMQRPEMTGAQPAAPWQGPGNSPAYGPGNTPAYGGRSTAGYSPAYGPGNAPPYGPAYGPGPGYGYGYGYGPGYGPAYAPGYGPGVTSRQPAGDGPAPYGRPLQKLHAWVGVLFFIGVMAFFYFILPIPLTLLGIPAIPSVILQQLFLLVTSVVFVLLMKEDLRTVFPVRAPKLSGVLGVFVIYTGTYMLEMVISTFLMYVAYDSLVEVQDSMFGGLSGAAYVLFMILATVMPAFCEEALNRGVVLHGLQKDLKNRWLIILISGVLFGVSHFYPVRMLAPAVLGFIMAWIMLETDNLFYTGLLHLLNNGFVMALSGLTQALLPEELLEESAAAASSLGSFETGMSMIVYGLFAPLIIYCGCYLMRRSVHGRNTPFVEPGKGLQAVLAIVLPVVLIAAVSAVIIITG